jgi:type IV pilus assembly protein PilV
MSGLRRHRRPGHAAQRGIGLLDGLVAVAILSFGLLGLSRFQSGMIAQSTEAQGRMVASQFADELLSTVLVDTANAGCYTLPQAGACNNTSALARATEWQERALTALPGDDEATTVLDLGTQRFTVTLRWSGKASTDRHNLQMTTDVR